MYEANEQKFGLLHQLDTTEFELAADFPVYSVADDMNITRIRADFQKPVNFEVPSSVYQAKPLARSELFMTEFDSGTLLRLLENAVSGDMCHVPSNKMYNDFLAIRFAHNGSIHSLFAFRLSSKELEVVMSKREYIEVM
uniref:Glycogen phosphorylase n=1 Tax=Angiostrongylus cantonensis TaxID=6313 RepID=A0A0K0CY99_ANGCA